VRKTLENVQNVVVFFLVGVINLEEQKATKREKQKERKATKSEKRKEKYNKFRYSFLVLSLISIAAIISLKTRKTVL